MRDVLFITKALADETRLRILLALRDRELCLCEVVDMLGLASSTVSKHLSILWQAGLVARRRQGRWTYFRHPGEDAPAIVQAFLHLLVTELSGDSQVTADARRLHRVVHHHPPTCPTDEPARDAADPDGAEPAEGCCRPTGERHADT